MMMNNMLTARLFRQIGVFWKSGINHDGQQTTSAQNENDFELYAPICNAVLSVISCISTVYCF